MPAFPSPRSRLAAIPTADVMAAPANDDHSRFSIVIDGTSIGELSLTLDGDFNYANAAAAVAIAHATGFDFGSAQAGRVA